MAISELKYCFYSTRIECNEYLLSPRCNSKLMTSLLLSLSLLTNVRVWKCSISVHKVIARKNDVTLCGNAPFCKGFLRVFFSVVGELWVERWQKAWGWQNVDVKITCYPTFYFMLWKEIMLHCARTTHAEGFDWLELHSRHALWLWKLQYEANVPEFT